MNNSKRGGARAGAGRPKKNEADKVKYLTASISLSPDDMATLKARAKAEELSISRLVKKHLID